MYEYAPYIFLDDRSHRWCAWEDGFVTTHETWAEALAQVGVRLGVSGDVD